MLCGRRLAMQMLIMICMHDEGLHSALVMLHGDQNERASLLCYARLGRHQRVQHAGQTEYQQLSPEELKACTDAARPGSARVREMHPAVLKSLYRRGLLYYDVPIWPDDNVSIPPLEVHCLHAPFAVHARRSIRPPQDEVCCKLQEIFARPFVIRSWSQIDATLC